MADEKPSRPTSSSENDSTAATDVAVENVPSRVGAAEVGEKNDSSVNDRENDSSPAPPPDGGLEAWLCVLAGCFIFMNSWGIGTSFGAFQEYYQHTMFPDTTPSAISWIGSVQSTLITGMGLVVGPLTDRGYIRPVILMGSFLVVFGLAMTSLATSYWQVLLAQGFCVGAGSGSLNVPVLTLVTSQFTTKRQVAISFVSVGSSIGGVVFPIMFRRLQPTIGFAWAVRAMALVSLVLSIATCIILCRRPGVAKATSRAVINVRAFTEPGFTLFAFGLITAFLAYFFPLFYITSFAVTKLHASDDYAFYLTSITNGSSFFGRLMPFWLRLLGIQAAPLTMLHTWVGIEVLLLFTWIAVGSLPGFTVWCVAWGILTGAIVTSTAPAVAHPTLTPSLDQLGGRMGMAWAATSIGTLIGAPIAGALADVPHANYLHAQIFAGAITVGGVAMLSYPVFKARSYDRREQQKNSTQSSEAST